MKKMSRLLPCALLLGLLLAPAANHASPSTAVRAGWAYGLGAELEYRPDTWGVGVSGGYVPGYGAGGYLGAQWGAQPLGSSGVVAEGGVFRGVPSPLRAAPAGLGLYLLGGYAHHVTPRVSIRLVAGGGMPFAREPSFPSFEFLAKLTAGVVF